MESHRFRSRSESPPRRTETKVFISSKEREERVKKLVTGIRGQIEVYQRLLALDSTYPPAYLIQGLLKDVAELELPGKEPEKLIGTVKVDIGIQTDAAKVEEEEKVEQENKNEKMEVDQIQDYLNQISQLVDNNNNNNMLNLVSPINSSSQKMIGIESGENSLKQSQKRKKSNVVKRRAQISQLQDTTTRQSASPCSSGSMYSTPPKQARSAVFSISKIWDVPKQRGKVTIPILRPALLNIEKDSPLVLPTKSNYLSAGLLSNHYKKRKENVVVVPQASSSSSPSTSSSPTTTTNRILPRPVYLEEYLFKKQRNYVLPFDVWCLGAINSRNSAKQVNVSMSEVTPESWKFKTIRTNVYSGVTKPKQAFKMEEQDQLCPCPNIETKCESDSCLNRYVFVECPALCGDNCRNRRIQKDEHADVERFLTPNKGYGIMTRQPIKKGEFILEYVGEVVSDDLYKTRMCTIYSKDTHHYCMQLDGRTVIDGHRMGGECRFVNHSCEPNCEMQKWSVNGLSRMALFALRDIEQDEELTYDYNFSLFNPAEGQPCYCGSMNCRGVIGDRRMNSPSGKKVGSVKQSGDNMIIQIQNMI